MSDSFRLVKLGADWCGPCQSMKKSKVLEKFCEEHEELELELVDVESKDGEALADELRVKSIPTICFMLGDEVLARDEGTMTKAALERLYEKAVKKLPDDVFEELFPEDEDDEEDDDDEEEDNA